MRNFPHSELQTFQAVVDSYVCFRIPSDKVWNDSIPNPNKRFQYPETLPALQRNEVQCLMQDSKKPIQWKNKPQQMEQPILVPKNEDVLEVISGSIMKSWDFLVMTAQ